MIKTPYQDFMWTISGPWTIVNTRTDTEVKIDHGPGIVWISFQGTGSRTDWIYNFRFARKAYKRMQTKFYAHKGFLKKYHSVRDQIIQEIRNANAVEINVRGYSQGAACAFLCFEDVKFHFPEAKITGIGYGTPRVLHKPSANIRRRWSDFRLVINGDDIVTKLPPRWTGYRDVGEYFRIGDRPSRRLSIDDHMHKYYAVELKKL